MLLLEESKRTLGISVPELFSVLPMVLAGQALDWFRLESQLTLFAEFRYALRKQFQAHDDQDRLVREALNLRQARNESIISFVTNLRTIYSKIIPPVPLETQLSRACSNLNPSFIFHVKRSEIRFFEDLIAAGRELEAKLERVRKFKGTSTSDFTANKAQGRIKKVLGIGEVARRWPLPLSQSRPNQWKEAEERKIRAEIKSPRFHLLRGQIERV